MSKTEILPDKIDLSAQQIEELAKTFGIPLQEDSGVIASLARLDAGAVIPTDLYQVISQVLGYVYRVDAEAEN